MTTVLTDCPGRGDALLGRPADWRQVGQDGLDRQQRAVWRALDGSDPLWRAAEEGAGPRGYWRDLFLVADAPRSQFDAVQEALRRGVDPGGAVACLAGAGHGFHGQRGRAWSALEGNLHLTAAVPVNAAVTLAVPALTMLPAVAALEAMERASRGRLRPRIKWVNDILLDERKAAGVLTATLTRGSTVHSAVFGVGVNVARAPELAPSPFVPDVTCMQQAGAPELGLHHVLWPLLDALAAHLAELLRAGADPLLARYRQASLVVGRRVAVYAEESDGPLEESADVPLARGVVEAINPDLSLKMAGRAEPVRRGRLVLLGT